MITVIVLCWMGLLALLVKVGILKRWYLWMKLSPIAIFLIAQILLLLPMGFDAPSGSVVVLRDSVQILPPVSGTVTEVPVRSGVSLKKGDTLFEIDKFVFQATVDKIEAKLKLAEQALNRQAEIAKINAAATSQADADRLQAEYDQVEADLRVAREMLVQTTVRAPFDGIVTNKILEPGAIVVASSSQVMSFVDNTEFTIAAQIDQINLRNVQVGQSAEVIFKLHPGKVFEAEVREIIQASAAGLMQPQANVPQAFEIETEPFWVLLDLDDQTLQPPAGATGTVAIYTSPGGPSELMRKIVLRMENWLNFVNPF